jgi:hypothetical protein
VNEQTALLSNRDANSGRQRTPLPKLQLAVVLLIQSCEVVARSSISPYINQVHLVHLCRGSIHVLISIGS